MPQYLIETANPNYSGKSYGVTFHDGRAVLDEHTCPAGHTVDGLVRLFRKDLGYHVTELPVAPASAPRPKRAAATG